MQPLATPGLVLEPITRAHAESMFDVLADAAIHRHLDTRPPPSVAHLREVYRRLESRRSPDARQHRLNWVLRPRPSVDAAPIGYVQATVEPDGRAWIGYVLASRHWGHGHAGAAVGAVLRHLEAAYRAGPFLATVEAANERSLRLLARLGFRPATLAEAAGYGLTASERLFVADAAPPADTVAIDEGATRPGDTGARADPIPGAASATVSATAAPRASPAAAHSAAPSASPIASRRAILAPRRYRSPSRRRDAAAAVLAIAMATTTAAQAPPAPEPAQAAPERRNAFDDPFFQVASDVAACPLPAGPFATEAERLVQSHRRAELGTTCWLAGRCAKPNFYAYDRGIAAALEAALRGAPAVAGTTLWVTVQGRVVYLEGCARDPAAPAALEAIARSVPDVTQAIAIVRTDPAERPPYKLRTAP